MRLIAILFIFSFAAVAQVRDRGKDRSFYERDDEVLDLYEKLRGEVVLSRKYRAGAYLIYDCEDKHFACVDEVSYKLCQKYRKEDQEKKKELLSCGAIKKFETQKNCNAKLYEFIHRNVPKDFCLNTQNFLRKF